MTEIAVPPECRIRETTRWHMSAMPLTFAGLTLLLHALSNVFFRYGYFRDEFYYLVCGDHLAFGYVDHPPLIAVIARVTRTLLGDSIVAIRLPSAFASAGLVLLTGLMARELGGRRGAQALACLCAVIAPVYLVGGNMLSTIPFDQLLWALCAYFAVRLITTEDPRYWLAIGATVGVGVETKHNMVFLACGLALGVLLTGNRRYLRSRCQISYGKSRTAGRRSSSSATLRAARMRTSRPSASSRIRFWRSIRSRFRSG